MNVYHLALAWLLGFVGLGAFAWIDPLVRHYGPMLVALWATGGRP